MLNKVINNSLKIVTLLSFSVLCSFTSSAKAQGLDFLGSAPLPPISKKAEKTEVKKKATLSKPSLFPSKNVATTSKVAPKADSFPPKKKIQPSTIRAASTKHRSFGTSSIVSPSEKVLGIRAVDIFRSMAEFERKNALLGMELEKERLNAEFKKVEMSRKKAVQEEKERQQSIVFERKLKEKEMIKTLQIKEKLLLHKIITEGEQLKQAILSNRETRKENFFQRKKELEEIKLEQLKLEKEIKEEEWKRKEEAKVYEQIKEFAKQLEAIKRASSNDGDVNNLDGTSTLKDLLGSSKNENIASELYMITEVQGVGGNLIAKLINKDGISFFVKKGTSLVSGHKVIAIEKEHVLVSKDGKKEILGFEGGGSILPTSGTGAKTNSGSSFPHMR